MYREVLSMFEDLMKTASTEEVEKLSEEIIKEAFIGFGVHVADLDQKGNWNLSVGFPYGVGVHRNFGDNAGFRPTVGLGLTGPQIGAGYFPSSK